MHKKLIWKKTDISINLLRDLKQFGASYMVSRIDPLISDLGFSMCDRVNPGIRFIPKRSCSQATPVSCRLIFLWTVPNLTHGNLPEITYSRNTSGVYRRWGSMDWRFHVVKTNLLQLLNEDKLRCSWFRRPWNVKEKLIAITEGVQAQNEGHVVMQKTGFCNRQTFLILPAVERVIWNVTYLHGPYFPPANVWCLRSCISQHQSGWTEGDIYRCQKPTIVHMEHEGFIAKVILLVSHKDKSIDRNWRRLASGIAVETLKKSNQLKKHSDATTVGISTIRQPLQEKTHMW